MRMVFEDFTEQNLANNLKAIRELRNFSQPELAEKVGTDQSMISKLENGERQLTPKWMEKLSVPLKVEPYQLMQEGFDIDNLQLPLPETRRSIPESQSIGLSKLPLYATIRRGVARVDHAVGPTADIDRPTYLNNVRGAFGLQIIEKTLHKLDINDTAYAAPFPKPMPGNIVVILHADQTMEVSRLISETAEKYNFAKELPTETKFSLAKDKCEIMKVRGQEYGS